jgi:hypothetical protein
LNLSLLASSGIRSMVNAMIIVILALDWMES